MALFRPTAQPIRSCMLLLLLSCANVALAQEDVTDDAPQESLSAPGAPDSAEDWATRADTLINAVQSFARDREDADTLFLELDLVLNQRVSFINQRMRSARSPRETIDGQTSLPPNIVTIADLHEDVQSLYETRLRLLEFLTPSLHLEIIATDVIGVSQLGLELQFIWEQVRFRALNLPAASDELWRRIQIAPLPVLWQFVKFLLIVAIFRWWRQWFPETLRRTHISLAEIRPRSSAIMRKIRIVWYIGQLRRPLEWMLLSEILFSMINMPGLNFIVEIVRVIVRWILLGWLSVSLLNAVAARGDAGLTGEDATVRLKSFRLVATWLVLLGLGLSLAESLAGVATLYAWVWRLFQLLALPVLIVLLSWWRQPIFTRLERESEHSETVTDLLTHRKGFRSYRNAARGGAWLLANALRRNIMRTFLRVGADQGIAFSSTTIDAPAESKDIDRRGLSEDAREKLLSGESGYERHARAERRRIVSRVNSGQAGVMAIVGERGVGKSAFLRRIQNALDDSVVIVDAAHGSYDQLEADLASSLSTKSLSAERLAERLIETNTKVIAIDSLHRLVRPVIGGQEEFGKLMKLIENTDANVLWIFSVDCFAWQFLRRARADRSTINEVVQIPAWTEDQLSDLLDQRNEEAGLDPDFSKTIVPDEFMVTTYDTAEERNKASVYRMLWMQSAGNPVIALLMWANCLYYDDDENLHAGTPVLPTTRDLDEAVQNVLLVMRAIALAEEITEEDIADNLRLPAGAISGAMHYCLSRGWIEAYEGRYRLNMGWFRTITRTLSRQNLLAR